MARQAHPIDHDLMDEPHVAGRRVSVLQLYEQVEGSGRHPADVAEQLDLDVGDVYAALAYYHEHPDEMTAVRNRRSSREARLREEVADELEPGSDDHSDVLPYARREGLIVVTKDVSDFGAYPARDDLRGRETLDDWV